MSFATATGEQVDPADLTAPGALEPEDVWQVVRSVVHDERLDEDERMRLMWAVLDAAAPVLLGR